MSKQLTGIKVLLLSLCLAGTTIANADTIAVTGSANTSANAAAVAADRADGSTAVALTDPTTFNALSTADLLAAYDMLLIGWTTSSLYNFDWATVLLPYLEAGGAISWEDPVNLSELYAGSGLSAGSNGLISTYTGAFGPNTFTSPHFGFNTSSSWECIAVNTSSACGIARATFGLGRIVVSGPDEFWHDSPLNAENRAYLNAQTDWLLEGGTAVPEPGTLMLFGLGLLGLAATRRRTS